VGCNEQLLCQQSYVFREELRFDCPQREGLLYLLQRPLVNPGRQETTSMSQTVRSIKIIQAQMQPMYCLKLTIIAKA
jgi:hypothetical protein